MDKKRKDRPHQEPNPDELDEESLALTLAPPSRRPRQPLQTPKNPSQAPCAYMVKRIPPPFPWATECRASVHSLESLLVAGILKISGEVSCKRCNGWDVVELDLQENFTKLWLFVDSNNMFKHDQAPEQWMCPMLMDCRICGQRGCVQPVVSTKKRTINWLFLLLSQTLGCCKRDQLRYFLKHTGNNITGKKNRLLNLTYLDLCEQLVPNGLFSH